jgi:large subunit ribosomal protein L4
MEETTKNQEVAAFTAGGTERERVSLPSEVFDGTINVPVMHQAVKAFLANQRQGNAKTKTRGFVIGGNQKPWKQKGTGRARQGSTRAPNWVGGGTVFGPIPRSYAEYVPRQVRALARRSALNVRAAENAVMVIDSFSFEEPKTSRIRDLVERLGVADRKVLILTDGTKPAVYLSARNMELVHVMAYSDVSTYHILWSSVVLIEGSALGHELEPVEEKEPAEPVKKTRKAAARKPKADKAEKKTSAKAKGPARTASKAKKTTKAIAKGKAAAKKTSAKKKTSAAKKKTTAAKKKSSTAKKATKSKSAAKPKKKGN